MPEETIGSAGPGAPQVFKGGGVGVLGLGAYIPDRVMTNFDLEKMVNTNDEWIVQRTGISERRIAAEGETTADMSIKAAKAALDDAGIDGAEVGLVIVATASPDYYSPATASIVQNAIGAKACAAFDLNAGCTGSLYALVMAHGYIRGGACRYALVVGAETLSRVVDWTDRKTCVLFGDGAGAAVLGAVQDGRGILSTLVRSDGEGSDLITIPGLSITRGDLETRGGVKKSTIWMDGGKVMKFASRIMAVATNGVLEGTGYGLDDVELLIPHQANLRIIESGAKRLKFGMDRIFANLQKYGNTSAASILIAMKEAAGQGRLLPGVNLVVVAFGAGLTYGAALIKW